MIEPRLKVRLELHIVGDGRRFLNFWNAATGDDVIAEIKDGELFVDEDGTERKITLQQLIDEILTKAE